MHLRISLCHKVLGGKKVHPTNTALFCLFNSKDSDSLATQCSENVWLSGIIVFFPSKMHQHIQFKLIRLFRTASS